MCTHPGYTNRQGSNSCAMVPIALLREAQQASVSAPGIIGITIGQAVFTYHRFLVPRACLPSGQLP